MIDPKNPDFTNTPVSSKRPSYEYNLKDSSVTPYVTIITPFYNTGSFFDETARSVLQQSFQQWEWLIINDGSSDEESRIILDSYRDIDPRIKVIDHDVNRGLSAARNTGFRAARSDYIVQIDSDDLLEPTAVEKWWWFLESFPEYGFCKGFSVGFGSIQYLHQFGFHNREAFLIDNLVDSNSMIRKDVHKLVGEYDETNRDGLEDYEFWLRSASFGYWGDTIPEYLSWYRRRNVTHTDKWVNLRLEKRISFLKFLRARYPKLWEGHFPKIITRDYTENAILKDELPCENRLRKNKPRLLIISESLIEDEGSEFHYHVAKQLSQKGWEVTLAIKADGDITFYSILGQFTPDIFILNHYIRKLDYPRFLRYLIRSRNVDVVLIDNSMLGYMLLPYFRSHFPDLIFIDYINEGSENAGSQSCYELGVNYQKFLNLNVVSSEFLKTQMIRAGADSDRIDRLPPEIDTEELGEKMLSFIDKAKKVKLADETLKLISELEAKHSASEAIKHLSLLELKTWCYEIESRINSQHRDQLQLSNKSLDSTKEISDYKFDFEIFFFLYQRYKYLEEQANNWQNIAESWGTKIWELHEWIEDRERAIKWWQSRSENWERVAEERNYLLRLVTKRIKQKLSNLIDSLVLK